MVEFNIANVKAQVRFPLVTPNKKEKYMKKNHVYQLELGVKWLHGSIGQNIVNPDWKHVGTKLEVLADFVYRVVREYKGDFNQREITMLRLTRYTEADSKTKKINGGYGKGFFGWDWVVGFYDKKLDDINKSKINPKNEKKFKAELIGYWKDSLKQFDKRIKELTNVKGDADSSNS